MNRLIKNILLGGCLILFSTTSANAQVNKDNPYNDDIRTKAESLAKSLTSQQVDDLAQLREAFGMIESIYLVKDRVGEAVNLCADANPDLRNQITGKYTEWTNHVVPILDKKQNRLDQSISAEGRFDNPQAVRDYFELINKAAEYADKQLDRKPVTTKVACKSLHDSMDNTKNDLVALLNKIEWPDAAARTEKPVKKISVQEQPVKQKQQPVDTNTLLNADAQSPAAKDNKEMDQAPMSEAQRMEMEEKTSQ